LHFLPYPAKSLAINSGAAALSEYLTWRPRGDVLGCSACQKIDGPLPFQEIPGCDAQGDPCRARPAELVHHA
jgi:hypothetical protein